MTTFERRQTILRLIHEQPSVRVAELAEQLDVSEGTIRNDLTALEEDQQIMRVRGGAVLKNSYTPGTSFATRARVNYEAKQRIARWAADMIEDGDAILMDASTTVLSIAAFLQDHRNLTIVTNGIDVARLLAQNTTNTVILLGGVMRADGSGVSGLLGEALLANLQVKTAFVSCVGFSFDSGLLEDDIEQAQIKSLMLRSARQIVALVDSSKFEKPGLVSFAPLAQVGHIVTDDSIAPEVMERLRSLNLGLTICGENAIDAFTPHNQEVRHYTIGFANLSENILFAVDVRRGLERAVKNASNIHLVLADNQLSGETALTVADHLLARGVDLVIEYQIDESVGSLLMDKFSRASIPAIAVDIPMVGATYFGVDNYRAGFMAGIALGNWINEYWDGRFDHVVVLEERRSGALPGARIQGQINGLQETIGKLPAHKISYVDSGNTSAVSEENFMRQLRALADQQRIGVISFNDDAALGALAAARRLGRESDIAIVGQGADRRMREEIRRSGSRIIGSTAYMPDRYGERLIEIAQKLLRNEPVPPAIYSEHVFLNAANVDLFYLET